MLRRDIYWLDLEYWVQGNAWSSIASGRIHWLSPFITQFGYMGVIFFFVLSGYLITYLLLHEKQVRKTVGVRHFYLRRILRIWPLYFFITLLGFFVFPFISWTQVPSQADEMFQYFWLNVICYLVMLPNLAFAIVGSGVPNIGQLWSIGVEEQFYLAWPVFMKYMKRPLPAILILVVVILLIKLILYLLPGIPEGVMRFVGSLKIECMAAGGIGACLVFMKKQNILRILYHPATLAMALLSIPAIVLFTPKTLYIGLYILFTAPFLIIIMNVSANKKCFLRLENKVLDYLGRISYGIYMFHLLCITFSFHLLDWFFHFSRTLTTGETLLLHVVSLTLTIAVSAASYQYLEKRFIHRKRRYTTIISGDDAK